MGGGQSHQLNQLFHKNNALQAQLNKVQQSVSKHQQQNKKLTQQNEEMLSKLAKVEQMAFNERNKYYEELRRISKQQEEKNKELDDLKDIKKIKEAEEKIFLNFLNQLKSFQVVNPLPKPFGFRNIAIIGQNSAGKSSLFNYVLGLKLEVGIDDTTQNIEKVHMDEDSKLFYYDSPGLNQSINITHAHILQAFYSVDIMFIATSVTFKNSIKSIQVMNKINPPKLYLVRNQCDRFDSDQELMKCKKKDYAVLKEKDIYRPILYVSTRKDATFLDNAEFIKLMKGQ